MQNTDPLENQEGGCEFMKGSFFFFKCIIYMYLYFMLILS